MTYAYDSSAVLAMVALELGNEVAFNRAAEAVISSVNYAEVVTKLVDWGYANWFAEDMFQAMGILIIPFDAHQALEAGILRAKTRSKGLSLGDRACLALAKATGRIALTADRAWADLDVGVAIELIR